MPRFRCHVFAHPVLRRQLLLRTLVIEADAPDTAGVQAFADHEALRKDVHGTGVESLPAHSVTVVPIAPRTVPPRATGKLCPWCDEFIVLQGEDSIACCPTHGVVEAYAEEWRECPE